MKFDQRLLDIIYNKFSSADIDSYLLQNHKDLFNLFNMVDMMTDRNNYKGPLLLRESFSKKDILHLENKFLSSLKPKYSHKFIADYIRGRLVQNDEFDSTTGTYHRKAFGYYRIDYPKKFNLGDFSILTHEYIHHLSTQFPKIKKDTSSYNVYREVLSILGQLKSLDFLKKNVFPQSEIEIYKNYIRQSYQENFNTFYLLNHYWISIFQKKI